MNLKKATLSNSIPSMKRWTTREVLEKEKFIIATPDGHSMLPFIKNTDRVCVSAETKPENFRKNEIAVFSRNGKTIAHRIIRKKDGFLVTRGYNCLKADNPVLEEDLIGKVRGILRDDFYLELSEKRLRTYSFFANILLPVIYTGTKVRNKLLTSIK